MNKTQEEINKEINGKFDRMTKIIYTDEDILFIEGSLGERNDVYIGGNPIRVMTKSQLRSNGGK